MHIYTVLIAVLFSVSSAAVVDARPLPKPDRFYSERPPVRSVEQITADISVARENGDDARVQESLQAARAANRAKDIKQQK